MLRPIVAFLLRGPTEAIACSVLCSVIPFAYWLTHVIIGLVTLRKGPAEGAFVLLWSSLPSVVLAATIQPQVGWYSLLGFYVLGYVLATILHYTATWSVILNTLFVLAIVTIGGTHWLIPDVHTLWLNYFQTLCDILQKRMHTPFHPTVPLSSLAAIATGTQIAFILLGNLWNLGIARGLQSTMFNPGAFYEELRQVRLHPSISIAMIINVLLAANGFAVGLDMLPIIGLIGGLSGLSITALITYNAQFKMTGYIVLYSVLVAFLPYSIGGLILLAWVNSFVNIPKHYGYKSL